MRLSLVICVYNTDKALFDGCLSSVYNNTVRFRESFELCIVDDGSTVDYSDLISKHSEELCINYKKTENRGIFLARQLGAEMAKGDFIAFMDSDDSVSCNYYLPMLRAAERDNSDIVMNGWAFHTERAKYCCKSVTDGVKNVLIGKDALSLFLTQEGKDQSLFVLWNKIYRSDVLKSAVKKAAEAVGERELFNYSEDALINFFAHSLCKRLSVVDSGYYFYRAHPSQIVNVISEDRLRSQIEGMSLTLDIMEESISTGCDSYRKHIANWRGIMSRSHYSHARAGGYESLYPIIKERYRVKGLKKATLKDGECYSHNTVLGENFTEIDGILLSLFKCEGSQSISYEKSDGYVCRSVAFMNSEGCDLYFSKNAQTVIPKQKASLKIRFLHNYYVYTLGMLLFPKGSKIRAFLKKHI